MELHLDKEESIALEKQSSLAKIIKTQMDHIDDLYDFESVSVISVESAARIRPGVESGKSLRKSKRGPEHH